MIEWGIYLAVMYKGELTDGMENARSGRKKPIRTLCITSLPLDSVGNPS